MSQNATQATRPNALRETVEAFDAFDRSRGPQAPGSQGQRLARYKARRIANMRAQSWTKALIVFKMTPSRILLDDSAARQRITGEVRKAVEQVWAAEARLLRRIRIARLRNAMPYIFGIIVFSLIVGALLYAAPRLPEILEFLNREILPAATTPAAAAPASATTPDGTPAQVESR